jgi:hypothetical protein
VTVTAAVAAVVAVVAAAVAALLALPVGQTVVVRPAADVVRALAPPRQQLLSLLLGLL